jgi:hypothetical protein
MSAAFITGIGLLLAGPLVCLGGQIGDWLDRKFSTNSR